MWLYSLTLYVCIYKDDTRKSKQLFPVRSWFIVSFPELVSQLQVTHCAIFYFLFDGIFRQAEGPMADCVSSMRQRLCRVYKIIQVSKQCSVGAFNLPSPFYTLDHHQSPLGFIILCQQQLPSFMPFVSFFYICVESSYTLAYNTEFVIVLGSRTKLIINTPIRKVHAGKTNLSQISAVSGISKWTRLTTVHQYLDLPKLIITEVYARNTDYHVRVQQVHLFFFPLAHVTPTTVQNLPH